jgi:hypothetical protein
VFTGPSYVRTLRSLIASAEQQNHLATGDCVVNPISRPDIDAQFPYPVAAKLVVPEVSQLNAIDSPVDGNSGLRVAELSMPLQIKVFLI